jgi:hypothetical protein
VADPPIGSGTIRIERSFSWLLWAVLLGFAYIYSVSESDVVRYSLAAGTAYTSLALLLERAAPRAHVYGEAIAEGGVVFSGEPFQLTVSVSSWLLPLVSVSRVDLLSDSGISVTGIEYEKSLEVLRLHISAVARVGTHEVVGVRIYVRLRTLVTAAEITLVRRLMLRAVPKVSEGVFGVGGGAPYDIGTSRVGTPGSGTQFFGSREYRYGDELKRVDWKASLRTGRLIVKLFEKEVYRSVLLVVPISGGYLKGRALDTLAMEVLRVVLELVRRGTEVSVAIVARFSTSNTAFVKLRGLGDLGALTECLSRIEWRGDRESSLTYRTALWFSVRLLSEVISRRSLVVYVGEPESDVDVVAGKIVSKIVRNIGHEPVFAVVSPSILRLMLGEASAEDLVAITRTSRAALGELSSFARTFVFLGDDLLKFLARAMYA